MKRLEAADTPITRHRNTTMADFIFICILPLCVMIDNIPHMGITTGKNNIYTSDFSEFEYLYLVGNARKREESPPEHG
jgi:hypothetical protein